MVAPVWVLSYINRLFGGTDLSKCVLFQYFPFPSISCFLGLINARSVNKRAAEIHYFLHSTFISVLAITETWFAIDHGSDDLRAFCPDGYSAVHVPRCGSKGGGVAILYRNTIRVDPPPLDLIISATTFEWLSLSLVVNSVSIRLIVV